MCPSRVLISFALIFLLLRDPATIRGDEKSSTIDLHDIKPPAGAPLLIEVPGRPGIRVDLMNRVRVRQDSAPPEKLDQWVAELERIMDMKLEGLVKLACRTYIAIRVTSVFDELKWNAEAADRLFQRAQSMPTSEGKVWKETFETVLKKEIGQTDSEQFDGGPSYAVPLVLISIDLLHDKQKYNIESGKKYQARLRQLTAEDVALWRNNVDQYGGTALDAAVNIILLDDFFSDEKFQRDKFRAAVEETK